jgi:hypothetical protein
MFGINPSNSTYIGPIDAYAGGAIFYGVSANVSAQTFYTGASARMHINSTGNVGIGTTSPGYKLDVAGEVRANNLFRTTDGTNIGLFGSSVFASNVIGIGSSNAVPLVLGTAATERMRIDSSGNVGIGTTSPGSLLHLESASSPALQIKDTTNNVTFKAYAQDSNTHLANISNHDLFIDTNNTARITVKSSGNVGIGITSPSQTLEVAGTGIKLVNAANTHTHLLLDTANYDYKLGDISTSGGAYMQILSSTNQTFIYNSDLILSDGQKITITRSNPADPSCIYVDNTYTSFGTTYNIDSDVSSTLGSRHIGFRYNGTIVGFIGTNGTTAVTYSTTASDERLKKNIEDWQENILDKFEKIEPKEFNFISQEEGEGKTKGFIAQNMAEDFPEAYPHDYSEDKYYSFNPSGMVVYLMKAVKDLVEQNKQLETRIQTLEQQKQ